MKSNDSDGPLDAVAQKELLSPAQNGSPIFKQKSGGKFEYYHRR